MFNSIIGTDFSQQLPIGAKNQRTRAVGDAGNELAGRAALAPACLHNQEIHIKVG